MKSCVMGAGFGDLSRRAARHVLDPKDRINAELFTFFRESRNAAA